MPEKMAVLLDVTAREVIAMLAAYSQRPNLELVRALRAKLAFALNSARLIGVLHGSSAVSTKSPAISEAETGGWDGTDADTVPNHHQG